jgi:protein SCO1/2
MIRLYAIILVVLCTTVCLGQTSRPSILNEVGIDQKLDAQVPTDLVFKDESGNDVRLGSYFGSRPIVLSLVYYKCPMLCTLVLNDLTHALVSMPSTMSVGEQFDVITVSFDPRETPELAAGKKRQYLREYRRAGGEHGWHFLAGDEASIRKLTDAVGFRYVWDAQYSQYAHASGIIVLTPQGRIARYFYGIDYRAKDLRLALTEASQGTISSPVERVLLYCFHYDPATGKYGFAIMNILRAGGLLTVAAIGSFWFVMHRRARQQREHVTLSPEVQ